jgi:hypothetical protein
VRLEIGALEKAHLVGRDDRHGARSGELDRALQVFRLSSPADSLQLEIESPGEKSRPVVERLFGTLRPIAEERRPISPC